MCLFSCGQAQLCAATARKFLHTCNKRKHVWGRTMSLVMFRRYGAEFLGTFAYVFFGCGARILVGNSEDTASRIIIYTTFGLTLFIMSYSLSHISGAPFNPAATFGLAVAKRFPWRFLLPYWIAQVVGAVAASAMQLLLFPEKAVKAQFGATIPTVGILQAVIIEALITFFLMLVFMAATTDKRVNQAVVGLATGFTIIIGGFFAGPLTGGSMNPARSLAPALFVGGTALAVAWIYWAGPLLGAITGALVYEFLRGGTEYALQVPRGAYAKLQRIKGENGGDGENGESDEVENEK